MAAFEHLLKNYDVSDALDEIASASPPDYLRRCFAEGCAAPSLTWLRTQQLAVCAMVLDAVVNDRDYDFFEHELISDWRVNFSSAFMKSKDVALQALHRVLERDRPNDVAVVAEIEQLCTRLNASS